MRKLQGWMVAATAVVVLHAFAGAARAAAGDDEQRKVWDDVARAALKGPVDVPLLDEAVLHVPAGEVFVPQPQADRLLNLFGNPGANPEMPGLLLPRDPKAHWYMPVRFHKAGYIKDDDARTWDADEMLASLRVGTREQNRDREKLGIPAIEVEGWSEPPRYDAARQRLVWALTSHEMNAGKNAKADVPRTVNYNAFALGRDGYISMNLVAAFDDLPALRPVAAQQLAALDYNPGKRYADFDARTDPVAAFGLTGLVVDVASHQIGFMARMLALFARTSPLLAAAGVTLVVVLLALFVLVRRNRRNAVAAAPAAPPFVNTVAEPASTRGAPPPVDLDVGGT